VNNNNENQHKRTKVVPSKGVFTGSYRNADGTLKTAKDYYADQKTTVVPINVADNDNNEDDINDINDNNDNNNDDDDDDDNGDKGDRGR
jgi:hypothetical protein